MKPELGQTVYVIFKDSITERKVYALGTDFFIHDGYSYLAEFDSWTYYFEDYGYDWFFDFDSAAKILLERYADEDDFEHKIIQRFNDYWEII